MSMLTLSRQYNGVTILQRQDGYWNATAMCKANGKLWSNYWQNQDSQDVVDAIGRSLGIPRDQLIQTVMTGPNHQRGTWVHRRVAIQLASWCSPDFAAIVTGWVEELLTTGRVEIATPDTNPSPLQVVNDFVKTATHWLSIDGDLEERDKLLIKDFIRDRLLLSGPGASSAQIVTISERCVELNYPRPKRGEDSKVGRLVASHYRDKHNCNPPQHDQFVDGRVCKVNSYTRDDLECLDAGIRDFFDNGEA